MYSQDWDGFLPGNGALNVDPGVPRAIWVDSLEGYAGGSAVEKLLVCPSVPNPTASGGTIAPTYAPFVSHDVNRPAAGGGGGKSINETDIPYPSQTPYFGETNNSAWGMAISPNFAGSGATYGDRLVDITNKHFYKNVHADGSNMLFVDGHVKYVPVAKLISIKAEAAKITFGGAALDAWLYAFYIKHPTYGPYPKPQW